MFGTFYFFSLWDDEASWMSHFLVGMGMISKVTGTWTHSPSNIVTFLAIFYGELTRFYYLLEACLSIAFPTDLELAPPKDMNEMVDFESHGSPRTSPEGSREFVQIGPSEST